MFDDINEQIAAELRERSTAPSLDDLKATIDESDLSIEQAAKMDCEIVKEDGVSYVVSAPGLAMALEIDDAQPQAAEAAESEPDPTPDQSYSAGAGSAEQPSVDVQADAGIDTYHVGNLLIDVDPNEALAGLPTGEDAMGLRKLHNSHPKVPEVEVPYYPVDVEGVNRDSEDLFYRALGNDIPVILEGEAGTGKNQLVASTAATANLPMYRQEFGADTSVYEVVGEKDLLGDRTYYILGKAAKAAMFGGVYVADEINMATGSVTSYLHPLFERRGARELELRGTGVTLHDLPVGVEWDPEEHLGEYIHPDFHPVGTCNPLHYADTSEMNDALRSRCLVIEHPYLAESETDNQGIIEEAELVADETGADPGNVKPLVRTAAVLRQARREGNAISCPIGHREIRDSVEMAGSTEDFMTFKEAAKIKFVGQASLKQDKQFIRDTIEDEL